MSYKVTILAVALFVTTAFIGSAAYTSYTTTRDATISVDADSTNNLLKLADTDGDDIVVESSGQLTVDLSSGSNNDLAPNATLVVGDTADAENSSAFSITNADGAARTISFDFSKTWTDPDGTTDNVQFKVYDTANTLLGTVNETSGSVSLGSVASGSTIYVVMTIDTSGTTTTSTLDGDVVIKSE